MPPPEDSGEMAPFDPSVYSTNLLGSAAPAPPEEPLVFMGYTRSTQHTVGMGDQVREHLGPKTPTFLTISQVMSRFDNSTREEFLKLRNLMVAAGIVSPGADPYTVRSAFGSVIGQVSEMAASGTKLSPMGYIKNLIRMNGLDPSEVGSGENYSASAEDEPFTGVKRTTAKSVDEITEGEAWYSLQRTLSTMLGRDPSDQEVRNFTYRLNGLAAANPSISKTITRYKDGEAVSSSTKTSGGYGEADIAQEAYERAQNDDGYAEYQSATTYFNAAMSALGAIGQT